MNATIEPHLIHLLNDSTAPELSSFDLPPLTSLDFSRSAELPLPPIETEDTIRQGGTGGLSLINSTAPAHLTGDDGTFSSFRDDVARNSKSTLKAHPLHMLLSEADAPEQSTGILDRRAEESTLALDQVLSKKRSRVLNSSDDILQLPQPMKKQKASNQTRAMPPIINGLHEPPPHAALFPPISSSSFEEHASGQPSTLQDIKAVADKCTAVQANSTKTKKRATKPRSKWSESETNHLLLGVKRYGLGKWKRILEDPEFVFKDRNAVDLKDRFRTCCPHELRSTPKQVNPNFPNRDHAACGGKGADLNRILIHEEEDNNEVENTGTKLGLGAQPKGSRSHRREMRDLAQLGIHAPFEPSTRRCRRSFMDEEDKQILRGVEIHGAAWSKIQRDPRFDLGLRKPTDLRDRIRNAYPDVFQRVEKKNTKATTPSATRGSNDIMEPSVVTSINTGLDQSTTILDAQCNNFVAYREEFPKGAAEQSEGAVFSHTLDFGEAAGASSMSRDMDISRLLLDV